MTYITGLLVAVLLSTTGCQALGNNVVKVSVVFMGSKTGQAITDLSVVSGGDKFSWPALLTGASQSVNLKPGPLDDRRLILFYTLDGQKKVWEGPKIEPGKGYRIELTVDSEGKVTSRYEYARKQRV